MQPTLLMNPLHNPVHLSVLEESGNCGSGLVVDLVGVDVRRVLRIWNRGYKPLLVVAVDVHEALHIAVENRHIKRAQQYRRFEDVTEKALSGDNVDEFGDPEALGRVLSGDRSGVYGNAGDGWTLAGEPIS